MLPMGEGNAVIRPRPTKPVNWPASRWTGVGGSDGLRKGALFAVRDKPAETQCLEPRSGRRDVVRSNPSSHGDPGPARCWPRRRRFSGGTMAHDVVSIADRRYGTPSPTRSHGTPRDEEKGSPRRWLPQGGRPLFPTVPREKRLRRAGAPPLHPAKGFHSPIGPRGSRDGPPGEVPEPPRRTSAPTPQSPRR